MSPATTARAAAVPLSNGRISTSTPCFLKKPCFSATKAIITEKIGGMPGVAMTTFLSCADAGPAPIRSAASTAPPAIRLKLLRIMESSVIACIFLWGPRIIAVAGNRGHLWGEQHRIETRTKRNHSRVNSGRLTIGGNYSRSPYDERRTSWLQSQGYRVLRFWNNDVMKMPQSVGEEILRAARESTAEEPHPRPLPTRGRGARMRKMRT